MKRVASTAHVESVDEIEETAAKWLARRYGGFSAEEAAAFGAWRSADPRHAAAVGNIEQAWQVLSAPGRAGQGGIAQARHHARERHRERTRRRRTEFTILTLAAAALLVFALFPLRWPSSELAPPSRIVQRPDLQTLSDGSTVELNAGAEIEATFTAERRLVTLVRGETLFTVAKDVARPFVVSAGGVEVTAVGTAFTVSYGLKQVDVLVTEGTVSVERRANIQTSQATGTPTDPTNMPVILMAGNRSVVPLVPEIIPTIAPMTPAQISAALAWRERRIEFTRTPLTEAVDLFNRQNDIQLAVADPRTGAFEISGTFWANDPDSFVRLLESAFGMSVDRSDHKVLVRIK